QWLPDCSILQQRAPGLDWPAHSKSICNQVKRSRQKMNKLFGIVQAKFRLRKDETIYERAWALSRICSNWTRMILCFFLGVFLGHVASLPSDNIGVRYIISSLYRLYLRLNRDQDCYEEYDFGHMGPTVPYINLKNEDVFEGVGLFEGKYVTCLLVVQLTLFKLWMLLDLRDILHGTISLNYDTIQVIQGNPKTRNPIWSARPCS
ncbi:hypothetical protein CPB83DRAFT_936934, partial [Crepidotus variabilis]